MSCGGEVHGQTESLPFGSIPDGSPFILFIMINNTITTQSNNLLRGTNDMDPLSTGSTFP